MLNCAPVSFKPRRLQSGHWFGASAKHIWIQLLALVPWSRPWKGKGRWMDKYQVVLLQAYFEELFSRQVVFAPKKKILLSFLFLFGRLRVDIKKTWGAQDTGLKSWPSPYYLTLWLYFRPRSLRKGKKPKQISNTVRANLTRAGSEEKR